MNIHLHGRALLTNSRWNKGSAFTKEERALFKLEGLLPPHVSTIEEQLQRRYMTFCSQPNDISKYLFLMDLQEKNEVLFYRLVSEHIEEMLPFVYTPTVGEASLDTNLLLYHQNRGVYITPEDPIEQLLRNIEKPEVDIMVVTDGERVLGLGDVGIGGMVIPIGKSALYTLFGGIRPERLLPVFLDVGTNNAELLSNPFYVGLRKPRIRGPMYDQFIDRFVHAVKAVYPNALIQLEDFAKEHAEPILQKYREVHRSFNDDIQGTATVVLAGLLSATRIKKTILAEERIAIFGAGSAGLGIAHLIVDYLVYAGVSREEAYNTVYLVDKEGLINDGPFAKTPRLATLEEVVAFAKITVLIGTSAQAGAFTESIVKKMATDRPIIFPLSNPNTKAEADPSHLYLWTHGKAIVATGSPFPNTPQCNNVYIFPAIGLAGLHRKTIPQELFLRAAELLSQKSKGLFPELCHLKSVTKELAEELSGREISLWHPDYERYDCKVS